MLTSSHRFDRSRHPGFLLVAALLAAAMLILVEVAEGQFGFQIWNISGTPGSSREPVTADSYYGHLVAWEESGAEIVTRRFAADMIFPPISLGPGRDPAMCSAVGRVFIAFAREDAIVVHEWLGEEWSAPVILSSGMGFPTASPEFGIRLETADEPIYLAWVEERRSLESDIWFSERVGGAWRTPVRLRERIFGSADFAGVQVEPVGIDGSEEPRVYWFENDTEILFLERSAGQWLGPFTVPGSFGPTMEVAAGPDGRHHILTNGPQPTCPCNIMLYVEETATGWTDPEDISVPMDEYTWPRYPALRIDGLGRAHAFWYQSAYDFMLQPTGEAMFYFSRTNGVWLDDSWFFEMHAGIDNALSVRGFPVFAWVEGDPGSEEVFVGFDYGDLGVGDAGEAPGAARWISAYPNPASGLTRIEVGGLDRPEAVGVFDVNGRRVAEVALTPAGARALAIWNGQDDRGRPCPAGAYWLVAPAGMERLITRVTLVR